MLPLNRLGFRLESPVLVFTMRPESSPHSSEGPWQLWPFSRRQGPSIGNGSTWQPHCHPGAPGAQRCLNGSVEVSAAPHSPELPATAQGRGKQLLFSSFIHLHAVFRVGGGRNFGWFSSKGTLFWLSTHCPHPTILNHTTTLFIKSLFSRQ